MCTYAVSNLLYIFDVEIASLFFRVVRVDPCFFLCYDEIQPFPSSIKPIKLHSCYTYNNYWVLNIILNLFFAVFLKIPISHFFSVFNSILLLFFTLHQHKKKQQCLVCILYLHKRNNNIVYYSLDINRVIL